MITCCQCKRQDLAVTDFGVKGNGRKQAYCKSCQRAYAKEHYKANRKKYINKARKRNVLVRERNNETVDKLKSKPCADCGIQYPPWIMDFDHIPGKSKLKCISRMKYHSILKLMDEIEKCDLVCANCHRQRTHERNLRSRGGSW